MADFFGKGGTGSDILSSLPYVGAGISFLSNIFGGGADGERRKRQQELTRQNEQYRTLAVARANQLKTGGIKDISKETATQVGRASSDVARRAAATGRTGDTESMLLPVTSNINETGGRNLEGAIQQYDTGINKINTQFDDNAMSIQSDYAARPIMPDIGEELQSIGSSYVQGQNQDRYLNALMSMRGYNAPANIDPSTSMITPSTTPVSDNEVLPSEIVPPENTSQPYSPYLIPLKKDYSYLSNPKLRGY